MTDVTAGRKAADARGVVIRMRRLQHDVHTIGVSIEKFEIDILEAEQGIERTKEAIEANKIRMAEKELELKTAREAQGE